MNALSTSDIMLADEVHACIADMDRLRRNGLRHGRISAYVWQRQIIFRLAACCGLRRGEISRITLGDVTIDGPRPSIRVQKRIVKGRTRMRTVPLWWDKNNLEALRRWIDFRRERQLVGEGDPVVCVIRGPLAGGKLHVNGVSNAWKSAIRCLGKARVKQLSVHSGRHTFASHALNVGRSLMEVRDAMGHSDIAVTGIYAHMIERENVPDLYSRSVG